MKGKGALVLTMFLGLFSARFSPGASGLNLEDLLDSEKAGALRRGENPVLTQFNRPKPQLLPKHEVLREYFEAALTELAPSVLVETLHVYQKPLGTGAMGSREEANLFNGILALSTLAGLQYYSESRGVMRTFYETSSVIDGPSNKRPLPDPVYAQPPETLCLYARQKDLTFGDNIYQYDYFYTPGAIIFFQQNLTSLNAGIIPAVGKKKLRSTVAIIDAGDMLLVYAASMAKAVSIPGMNERVGSSFANRADAILRWFSDQADKAFSNAGPL